MKPMRKYHEIIGRLALSLAAGAVMAVILLLRLILWLYGKR